MKCHQLHEGIWPSRYAGASRNIDWFICIQMVTRVVKANNQTTKRISSPHISFEKIVPGSQPGTWKWWLTIRGARPVVTVNSAKKFAEKQGYRWVANPDRDLPYDALAYRDHDAIAIRVRTCRNSPGEFDLWEDFFRDDFEILKLLPMPEGIGRELWVRYVWSRTFQRYRVFEDRLSEITMIDREKPVFKRGVKLRSDPQNIKPIRRHERE
jgi:hypothetical protein